MGVARGAILGLMAAGISLAASPARANQESQALNAKAAAEIYNLDRELAVATYRQAVAADPQDVAAYRGLAGALWLSITFRRGNMTVDDYLGKVGHSDLKLPPPQPEVAAGFRDAVDHALTLARKEVALRSGDPEAHYQLGSAVGLRASYLVTVEGKVFGAVTTAREAYDEHEKVMEIDSKRADAGLIVGTYRYIVSAFSLPVRFFAYMAGFGSGKEKGLQLIRGAANYPGDNRTEARLALVLLDNRERKYEDAIALLAGLREEFPRNRILWLESGATNLRAGRPAEAERILSEGLGRFASDDRPRMFGEWALWYYKRGSARAALGRAEDADADLRKAISSEGRTWVIGRSHAELGKLALKKGNREVANAEFRQAIALCQSDNDVQAAEEVRQLLH